MIAIDLGSNTIRFIEYDGFKWGESFEKIVKTAESLQETGLIGENALERIIGAIDEAREKLDFDGNEIRAYTTAAMRLATNSAAALETIFRKTGIRFEIIDAQREADLTLSAVRYRLRMLAQTPSSFVMVDIGGGSTEVIVCEDERTASVSFNTGIVTLYESADSDEMLQDKIHSFETLIKDSIVRPADGLLVMTAGTPTTIAAYLQGMDYHTYDPARINGYILSLADCYRVYHELLAMDEQQRIRYVGVGRERLIGAGILMVTTLYTALGFQEAIIIDDSLREGIALDFFKN